MTLPEQILNMAIYVQTLGAFIWLAVVVLLERHRRENVRELQKRINGMAQLYEKNLASLMQLWRDLEQRNHDTDVPAISAHLWEPAPFADDHEKTDPGFQFPSASGRPVSGLPEVRKTPSGVMVSSRWHCTGCLRTFELTQFAHGKRCGWCGGSLEALPDAVSRANVSS